jgi:anti-sigma28 factor (negative regulator of flagellin synthesis)
MVKSQTSTNAINAYHDITLIAELKALVFDSPEANNTKIQLIKDEIAQGDYQINCDNIAFRLLEFAPIMTDKVCADDVELA